MNTRCSRDPPPTRAAREKPVATNAAGVPRSEARGCGRSPSGTMRTARRRTATRQRARRRCPRSRRVGGGSSADDKPSRRAGSAGPLRGQSRQLLKASRSVAPGADPLRPVPGVRPACARGHAVRTARSWRGMVEFTHPRTGGAHGKPHRTTKVLSHAQRRGGRVAACCARAAGGDAGSWISQQ